MIIWLYNQKNTKKALQKKLMKYSGGVHKVSLFFLVFFAILREGIETVLFMSAIIFSSGQVGFLGGFLGLLTALIIGYLLFVMEVKLPIKKFFQITGGLLIFFAAGLLARGINELQELNIIPIIVEHLYDMNNLFNEKGAIGQFAKGIFGYNGNPSLIEVMTYIFYVIGAFWLFTMKPRRH